MLTNIVIFFILPWTILFGYQADIEKNKDREQTPPVVKIERPDGERAFQWGSRVRYEISVSDEQDGESGYGEINPGEVLLEITCIPGEKLQPEKNNAADPGPEAHNGLSLIRKSACFNCHADKTSLTGPSFSDIADRYNPDDTDIPERLGKRIINGSSGQWGNFEMPPHEELSPEESVAIADYILEQGSRKDRWIYPGLEGVFQIMDKPDHAEQGVYILTASYVSHGTGLRGEHSILLTIE